MKKYRTIWVLLALLWTLPSLAQNATVHFGYDANGNRISRSLSIRKVEDNGKATDTVVAPAMLTEAHDTFGSASLSLFPNPTQGKLTLVMQGMDESTATARLITPTGAIIQQRILTDGNHDFDLCDLPSGFYLLQLTAPDMSQTWKIIKQ